MRYNKIRKMDISNGPGVRVSIFFQGCDFHCKGCFNAETWPFNKGKEFNDNVIKHVLDLCSLDYIVGLSILGGEPLHNKNVDGALKLAKAFKEKYPNKSLWLWTGNLFEDVKDLEIMDYLDVLVDGQFMIDKKDPSLKYCGSSNQRVIDVPKSLKEKKTVLFE